MPTKQPTPPPKFNIQDRVIYNFSLWKVTERKYKSRGWIYKLESFEENKQGVHNTEAFEKFITFSSHATPQGTKPMPDPEPGYRLLSKDPPEDLQPGDEWWEHDEQRWRGIHPQTSKIQHPDLYYRRRVKAPQKSTTVVNEQGGKQSHLDARFDCIPPVVLRLLAQCLGFGARKYGKENWKNIPQWDHLNHAMNHINEWNRGNRDEPHLVNAMARLTFALWQAVDSKDQPDTYTNNSSE